MNVKKKMYPSKVLVFSYTKSISILLYKEHFTFFLTGTF